MNKIISKILVTIIIIAAIIGAAIGLNHLENYEEYFYVQIDNSKISEIHSSDEMRFEYQLPGYSSEGKSKTLTFKTPRELRDRAYLKLRVKITGVNRWEEVQSEDIPNAAREKLIPAETKQ